jgi:hypothetical protein
MLNVTVKYATAKMKKLRDSLHYNSLNILQVNYTRINQNLF